MERSGNTVHRAGRHDDLDECMRRPGPYLTVWAADGPFGPSLRSMVAESPRAITVDIADALIEALAPLLEAGAAGIVGVTDATEVLLAEALPRPPQLSLQRIDALPLLSPIIEHRRDADDTIDVLRMFDCERRRGHGDRVSDGTTETLGALADGRVEVLLVHDDAADRRTAWFADEDPLVVADEWRTIELMGYIARRGRLVDVAIRTALACSASVHVVPSDAAVQDGIGAILRS